MNKKIIALTGVLAVALLAGCGAESTVDSTDTVDSSVDSAVVEETAGEQTATYTIYNTTGENVTELYLYQAGTEDKGENYAAEGMAANAVIELERTAASQEEADATKFVLEFTTESGATQHYDTVGFEVVDIQLLSVDAAAGATPITFGVVPEMTATYNVINTTGASVTELYLYEAGSEDKGENFAAEALAADASVVLTKTAPANETEDKTYVLEFVTEDGAVQKFETLHFEEANISLLSVDAAAGATPVQMAGLVIE